MLISRFVRLFVIAASLLLPLFAFCNGMVSGITIRMEIDCSQILTQVAPPDPNAESHRGEFILFKSTSTTKVELEHLGEHAAAVPDEYKSFEMTDNKAPGVGTPGHYRINVEHHPDGRVMLHFDTEIKSVASPIPNTDGSHSSIPMKVRHEARYEAEFTKGSWEDYLSGKPVELQLTSQAQKEYYRETSQKWYHVANSMRDMLNEMFQKTGLSSLVKAESTDHVGFETTYPSDAFEITKDGNGRVKMTIRSGNKRNIAFSFPFATWDDTEVKAVYAEINSLTQKRNAFLDETGNLKDSATAAEFEGLQAELKLLSKKFESLLPPEPTPEQKRFKEEMEAGFKAALKNLQRQTPAPAKN